MDRRIRSTRPRNRALRRDWRSRSPPSVASVTRCWSLDERWLRLGWSIPCRFKWLTDVTVSTLVEPTLNLLGEQALIGAVSFDLIRCGHVSSIPYFVRRHGAVACCPRESSPTSSIGDERERPRASSFTQNHDRRNGTGGSEASLTYSGPAATSSPQPSPVDRERMSVDITRLRRRKPVDGVGDLLVMSPPSGRDPCAEFS